MSNIFHSSRKKATTSMKNNQDIKSTTETWGDITLFYGIKRRTEIKLTEDVDWHYLFFKIIVIRNSNKRKLLSLSGTAKEAVEGEEVVPFNFFGSKMLGSWCQLSSTIKFVKSGATVIVTGVDSPKQDRLHCISLWISSNTWRWMAGSQDDIWQQYTVHGRMVDV